MKTRSKNHDVNSACKQSDVGVQTYTTNDTKAGEHKEHVDKLQTDLSIAVSRNQSLEALVNELNNACKDLSSRNRVLGDKLDMQGKDVTRLNNKLRVHKKKIETCKISQTNLTEDIRVICAKCQESEIQKTELSKELLTMRWSSRGWRTYTQPLRMRSRKTHAPWVVPTLGLLTARKLVHRTREKLRRRAVRSTSARRARRSSDGSATTRGPS